MADFLIKHLESKAEEHSALKMLVNQWGFDEKLIPKALQTVGNLFPHYSRHDESHSRQILINIERLLGKDNIAKLTATDTWLLLEAAYWHDIGMVVPHRDIQEALGQNGFQQYIEEIRNTPHHGLHRFCLSFSLHDMSQCFGGANTPIEAVDKFRELMAEWFRRQHAGRAGKIVEDPWQNAGISSPRTELIPARLFKLLGRICHMHGAHFQDLLAPSGLPFREAGLAQEDCHPRFVACLLRMGDLLDLDDNRFCPVMQLIAGENRPPLSKAHEDKHAGICHLRLDPERIEITAECETVDGYLEAFKWFDWLKQEMQNQMSHWQDIVPERTFGPLPTLGKIEVRLSGEKHLLNEGQRPQFSIDGKQATKLLSENLYSGVYPCIRELLQNAVDATLLKLWLINGQKYSADIWKSPFTKAAQEILNAGEVTVLLEETVPDTDTPHNHSRWKLTITDQGTGISRDDLSYMLRIGGSQANAFRQQKINTMPEWMKPSGAFGIGFQSVFLICDEVKLTTKSIFTNETLEIIMHKPLGKKEGLVEIKSRDNDILRSCGTVIEIILFYKRVINLNCLNNDITKSFTHHFVGLYDPVLNGNIPFRELRLADEIQTFSENSFLPICGKLITTEQSTSFQFGTVLKTNGDNSLQNWRFVEVMKHQIALKYQLRLGVVVQSVKTLFRGQLFDHGGFLWPNIELEINLLSGKAGQWLTANREKLAKNTHAEFEKLIITALEQLIQEDISNHISNKILINKETKPLYSLFLEYMALIYEGNWLSWANEFKGAWLDILTPDKETYRELFGRSSWILGFKSPFNNENLTGCDLVLDYGQEYLRYIIFNEWLKDEKNTVQVITAENYSNDSDTLRWQLKKEPQDTYTKEALATRLAGVFQRIDHNQRFFLDFQDKGTVLNLKSDIKIGARGQENIVGVPYLFDIPLLQRKCNRFILLPFLFCPINARYSHRATATPSQLDSLCKWLQPHLETPATLEEIRKAYEELIDYIDNEIMKPSPHWDRWKKARGI